MLISPLPPIRCTCESQDRLHDSRCNSLSKIIEKLNFCNTLLVVHPAVSALDNIWSNMPTPDVLVTGAAGHLGYALMLTLPSLGYTPLGIDILPCGASSLVGSIEDRTFITKIFTDHPTIKHVVHTATLHKPHIDSHTKEDFIKTNITGTLILLEEAANLGQQIESFVFISTTSAFGSALSPKRGEPAAWIDESVVPKPKNIYGVTKVAAENMCYLIHRQTQLPVIVLRTSRFFPEQDDDEDRRNSMGDENLKLCELLYRRVDIADVVKSCVCAMKKGLGLGWGLYIISATSPLPRTSETLRNLDSNPSSVIKTVSPGSIKEFSKRGFRYPDRIDRVYDSSKAVRELGWEPDYTFEKSIERLSQGAQWQSSLTAHVGMRGYHTVSTGVYTIK